MKSVFRCTPEQFDVFYAINAYMDTSVEVDKNKAILQWNRLGEIYREIGVKEELLKAAEGLPDMVFTANQSLPFWLPDHEQSGLKRKAVLLSNMKADERKPEVSLIRDWYEANGYEAFELKSGLILEGSGDCIYAANRAFLWGGCGYRTEEKVYDEVEAITGLEVKRLRMEDEFFYHLDVCLAVLDETHALAYLDAFDEASRQKIVDEYPNLIEVTRDEALNFVCNAHCPDKKHVILQEGSDRVVKLMEGAGFKVYEVDTSEYRKAGGSVFCMKMDLLEA